MQLIESPVRASETTIAIGPSVAVELSWVLLAARRDQLCESQSALAAFYRGTGGLAERVRSFWPDRVADFGEELVLADEASVIGSVDIEELLTGIADAATRDLRKPRLASEDESDRAVFLARLDRLRRAARLRREYVSMLRELWGSFGATWQNDGRRLVEATAERYRRRLERGAKWVDIVVADSGHLSAHLPELIERLAPISSVTIAPSFFSGQGLLLDLPSGVLVGVPATASDPGARERTEGVAKRLKALADPTRLAIAYNLGEGSMTVGEIAKCFDLAQPTVSTHVKILREAGIVSGIRRGNRLELVLRADAANELLEELKALLNRSTVRDAHRG
ncbi:MAG: metalloregulator ArsR/SmtB family transcription factor [Acidimicrobiales bacterium]|jgi:ArsR family transcriptional regulator, arsenate/arsenite/antimonite-responsive transcriptional repressor